MVPSKYVSPKYISPNMDLLKKVIPGALSTAAIPLGITFMLDKDRRDMRSPLVSILGTLGAATGGFTGAALGDRENRLRNAVLGSAIGGSMGSGYALVKTSGASRNSLLTNKALGIKTAASGGLKSFLGGSLLGGAATPWIDPGMWESRMAQGDTPVSRIIMNALMGGAGALTGHDRFKALGGILGAGAGVGSSKLLHMLRPKGEDTLSSLGRGALTGAQLSAITTLLASSGLRGGGVYNAFNRLFGGTGAKFSPVAEALSEAGTSIASPIKKLMTGISKKSDPLHYMGAKPRISKLFDKPGPAAKSINYLLGSPSVRKLVGSKTIQDTKALPYIGANLKDFAYGLGAGVPTLGILGAVFDPKYRDVARSIGIDPDTGEKSTSIAYKHHWKKYPKDMALLHAMPAAIALGGGKMVYDELFGKKNNQVPPRSK